MTDQIEKVTRALVVGRQAGDKILPKFFPPLGSSLNKPALVLRGLLWLAPCPEAEIMLLDWARTYPRYACPVVIPRIAALVRVCGFSTQNVDLTCFASSSEKSNILMP